MNKIELPETATIKLFVTLKTDGYDFGEIKIWDLDVTTSCKEYTLLTTKEVTFDIPKHSETEIKLKIVDNLQKEKEQLNSDHFIKIKKIDEKINQLLAIEYQPIDPDLEELPF